MLTFGSAEKPKEPPKEEPEESDKRSVSMLRTMTTTKRMRLLSEANLDDVMDWHLQKGHAYHFISCGDVDSLTFLRRILKEQPLKYVGISTWCMAIEDANEMKDWIERGMVGRIDFYVGEIFKNGYRGVRDVLDETVALCKGRVARFRNHSKVMFGFGEKYDFAIESSANINTNPRTEQTVITVDSDLAQFYKDYFDGINSFDPGYEGWEPWLDQ